MGGESGPWAIAAGQPYTAPRVFSVPDARDRDRVAQMVAEFAPILLSHVGHPSYASPPENEETDDLRQLWLPNGTHLEMLHLLNYTYSVAREERIPRAD